MALICGIALAAAETFINWGQWQWWPWWLVDYVAAAMLITGAMAVFGGRYFGRALLASGWSFSAGMGWMSLAGNIEAGVDPSRDARLAGLYTDLIAAGLVVCLAGLALTLMSGPKLND